MNDNACNISYVKSIFLLNSDWNCFISCSLSGNQIFVRTTFAEYLNVFLKKSKNSLPVHFFITDVTPN